MAGARQSALGPKNVPLLCYSGLCEAGGRRGCQGWCQVSPPLSIASSHCWWCEQAGDIAAVVGRAVAVVVGSVVAAQLASLRGGGGWLCGRWWVSSGGSAVGAGGGSAVMQVTLKRVAVVSDRGALVKKLYLTSQDTGRASTSACPDALILGAADKARLPMRLPHGKLPGMTRPLMPMSSSAQMPCRVALVRVGGLIERG